MLNRQSYKMSLPKFFTIFSPINFICRLLFLFGTSIAFIAMNRYLCMELSYLEEKNDYEMNLDILPIFFTDYRSDNKSLQCNRIHKNGTIITIYDHFQGIPENFFINIIAWLCCMFLFAFLRKKAWNYGRIALVQKSDKDWTQLFYGGDQKTELGDAERSDEFSFYQEKNFCSWLAAIFTIKDEQIRKKAGLDAVQYLSFQRHIIVFTAIICFISLTVALPINFQGTLQGGKVQFVHTTLSNLEPNSSLLWIFIVLPILFLGLAVFLMKRFSTKLKLIEHEIASRTLMIINVPKDHCSKEMMLQHFSEAYPELVIESIDFAYDIHKLAQLEYSRQAASSALYYSEKYLSKRGKRYEISPYICGTIFGSCCQSCCAPKVDAIKFYSEEEAHFLDQISKQKAISINSPLGIAFVTFNSSNMASIVFKDYQNFIKCLAMPSSSSYSKELRAWEWQVKYAPVPSDIYWENLTGSSEVHRFKVIFVNMLLFFIFFFLTTPAIFMNLFDYFKLSSKLEKMSKILSQILPVFFLWLITILLPNIIMFSDRWLYHWTRSGENYSIMRKTFIFLLFMILILPSLGLTSAQALLQWVIETNVTYRWECVFLTDNGALFVNYCITSSLIGTAMELLRFPELFVYVLRISLSRSLAERSSISKAILWEFSFGRNYAYMMLIFAITVTYSLVCPLVTPFGLAYMINKHLVDRYNIYFVYSSSKINKNIHTTAINLVIVSIFILQLFLMFFSILRRGLKDITFFAIAACLLTIIIVFGQVFFNFFKHLRPISYMKEGFMLSPAVSDGERNLYMPLVLRREFNKINRDNLQQLDELRTFSTDMDASNKQFSDVTSNDYGSS